MKVGTTLIVLIAITILTAFTLTSKDQKIVVIDIGHGGKDPGANVENTLEKEVNLKIAEKILALNTNDNIKLLVSRIGDEFKSIEDRIDFANTNNADLLISIHTNYRDDDSVKGIELFHGFKENDEKLADHFKTHLSKTHFVNGVKAARFAVLNKVYCPAIMVETGYLSNDSDRERLMSEVGQEALAKAILDCLQ